MLSCILYTRYWRKTVVSYHSYDNHVKNNSKNVYLILSNKDYQDTLNVEQIYDSRQFIGIVKMDLQPATLCADTPDRHARLKALLQLFLK